MSGLSRGAIAAFYTQKAAQEKSEKPKVSKLDIAEYYSNPAVQKQILEQIKNRPIVAIQTRPTGNIVRRNDSDGKPIKITSIAPGDDSKQNLRWYTDRRFSEFHPTIGKKTKKVWVDVDPGPSAIFTDVKKAVKKVVDGLKKLPNIKDTSITYSGGRGFHVRGDLRKKVLTEDARKEINEQLKYLDIPKAVFSKPKKDAIRLDTSTLKNKGSLRAAYSINSETGRIAVPLTERELRGFKPEHANLARILEEKEFAPGIPRSKRIYSLPSGAKDKNWVMAIQEHDAHRAGKHWDLRLVDPDTSYAHSWAIPKTKLPKAGGKPVLAVRTPTHTENYALTFGLEGPKQIGKGYGKGVVSIVRKEPIKMTNAKNNSIRFTTPEGSEYLLFRTKKDNWLLKNMTKEKTGAVTMDDYKKGYNTYMAKLGLSTKHLEKPDNNETSPLQFNDQHLAAGNLADVLQGTEDIPLKRKEEKREKNWDNLSTDPEAYWGPAMTSLHRYQR